MRALLAACAVALAALATVAGVIHRAMRPTSFKVAWYQGSALRPALTSFNLALAELHRSIAARRAALSAG